MKRVVLLFFSCVLCFVLYVTGVFAQVVINEFVIEPTPQVVELLNKSTKSVDISNWYIDDNGGTTYFTIPENTILYPNACVSFTSSFNLNRTTADTVRLFDSAGPPVSSSAVLVDSFSYKSSSGSGVAFQRIPDGEDVWATGAATFNLYNLTGHSCLILPNLTPTLTNIPLPTITPSPTSQPTITSVPTNTPTPTSVSIPTLTIGFVYLSELYPYPNTGENEWIELYNDNEFPVTLSNWKIDDVENAGSSPKTISLVISGYSFASFDINSSLFNNDGDSVRLLDENGIVKDSFSYEAAEQGSSIGRIDFLKNEYCIQPPSRNVMNNACFSNEVITPTPTPTTKPSPTPKNSLFPTLSKKNTPTPQPYIPQTKNTNTNIYDESLGESAAVLGEDTLAELEEGSVEVLNIQDDRYQEMAQFLSISSAVSSFLTLAFIFIKMMM